MIFYFNIYIFFLYSLHWLLLNTICKFQQYIYSYLFNLCSLSSLKIIFLKLWPGLMTFKNKNGFPLYIGFNLLIKFNERFASLHSLLFVCGVKGKAILHRNIKGHLTSLRFALGVYAQWATKRARACDNAHTRQNLGCSHRLRACDKYEARENGSSFSSFQACEQWMLLLLNC